MCIPTQKVLCGDSSCDICVPRSFATHPRASSWSSKNTLLPHQVLKNSNKKFMFDCNECDHLLIMSPNNIANGGQWCKYCNASALCDTDDCKVCFEKSFASHPMAVAWSSKNEKPARMIARKSEIKCWFDCADCHHTFQSIPYSIVKDKHCPYCTSQKLCEQEECKICFEKSCASHEMNNAWSTTNSLSSRQVMLQSCKKITFDCLACHHSYTTTPGHYYARNGSCPYCANKYLCEKEDCTACYQKSIASHPRMNCWSQKNMINPRLTFKGSETRCIFNCDVCQSEFDTKAYNVLAGYWCPYCKKKTEAKVLEFLKGLEGEWKAQRRFTWCRFSGTNNIMPFDFGSESKKILLEIDGEQHFSQVSNWDSPESVQHKDVEKIQLAIKEGYSVIHISQLDIWKDLYDWKSTLLHIFDNLKEANECCFISKNPELYQKHIVQLGSNIKYREIHP